PEPAPYSDALNATLGFQHVYVVTADKTDKKSNFEAIAALLDIDAQYIQSTSLDKAVAMREQNRYLADVTGISELDTHARIYADIVDRNIQSALIVRSDIDVELDIKMRLASALDNSTVRLYDSLIVGRTHSEPSEQEASEMEEFLRLTNGTDESSMQMQRYWTKKQFTSRRSIAHRTSFPRGISAYANSTLGFQKIFVLNTAARKDRRRNMEALGRFHKLRMEFAETFNGDTANALAASNRYLINGTHLACYLSHLQIYRRMVAEGIETALVLEDDVDMEMDIKERHGQIMKQIYRTYGSDWDMLYLGHCTTDANEPPADDLDSLATHSAYSERRVQLYETKYPMCLHAYAVTLDCAQRLAVLLEERLKTVGKEIDLILAVGVEYGVPTVLGTSPPYIVQVGRTELPSDLTQLKEGDTAQRLLRSTLYHLGLRNTDPQTLAPYMDWSKVSSAIAATE
ncbi:hypothetical protein H4R20_004821, partial [Coemansia guatemalensis]